jgi:AcrR family transcriptional regulator
MERRRQLMDFAARRFAENGYHPTSVAEIVAGLGVGKGVFYWYFSSKEELFLEILRGALRDLRRRQDEAIGDEPDPVRRIERGLRASMSWFAEHRDLVNLFQFAASEERFAPALRRGQEVAVSDAARHVKEAIAEGRIRDGDPELLTHAVLGVSTYLAARFIHERGEDADEVAEATVAFCLHGLLGA